MCFKANQLNSTTTCRGLVKLKQWQLNEKEKRRRRREKKKNKKIKKTRKKVFCLFSASSSSSEQQQHDFLFFQLAQTEPPQSSSISVVFHCRWLWRLWLLCDCAPTESSPTDIKYLPKATHVGAKRSKLRKRLHTVNSACNKFSCAGLFIRGLLLPMHWKSLHWTHWNGKVELCVPVWRENSAAGEFSGRFLFFFRFCYLRLPFGTLESECVCLLACYFLLFFTDFSLLEQTLES